MLRSVCFKNFVRFKDYQAIDFWKGGPSIFIGENGSGKSSVMEGIRRCLKLELSSSASSQHNLTELSFFICKYETQMKENTVICGIISLPSKLGEISKDSGETPAITSDSNEEEMEISYAYNEASDNQRMSVDENREDGIPTQQPTYKRKSSSVNETPRKTLKRKTRNTEQTHTISDTLRITNVSQASDNPNEAIQFYKFGMTDSQLDPMYVNLVQLSKAQDGETKINILKNYKINSEQKDSLLKELLKKEISESKDVDMYVRSIFENITEEFATSENDLAPLLEDISNKSVFTFPLRSVGPLQWSESKRIASTERKRNYTEAESRCEIIKYFLGNKDEMFDNMKEERYFKQITQMDDYTFELKDGKISLPKGKYALLKTPEGILEAKIFSILMSSKKYETLVLEEPDKGMHPQMIERMMQIINQNKNEKRVILTTHSTTFITPRSVLDTYIFRRHDAECLIISGRSLIGEGDMIKEIRLLTSDHISDILFAKKVLFYEGDSELLFFQELRDQILAGESKIAENIFVGDEEACNKLKRNLTELTCIKMNGKDKYEFCEKISKKLDLEYTILLDRDAVKSIRKKGKSKDERKKEEEAEQTRTPDSWREIRNNLFEKRCIFFWLDGTIEKMVEKIMGRSTNKKFLLHGDSSRIKEEVRLILDNCKTEHDLAEFIKMLK